MTTLELIHTAMKEAAERGNAVHVTWIKSKSGGSFKHHKAITSILINRQEFLNSMIATQPPKT